MKNKKLIYGIIAFLFLVALLIFVWNSYQIQIQERLEKPIKLPPQISKECGMTNCHGLDITCGFPSDQQACTEIYVMGDNCRQFASCQKVNDQCELKKTAKFDSCKSCVEKCENSFTNDPMKALSCEGKCAK